MNINDMITKGTPASDQPHLCCEQPKSALPDEMPIGIMYVPYQSWRRVYDTRVGLERGTVFEELDKPFIGEK